jgi:leucyl/phenylalanyl-tRNA--protein transferase
VIPWLGAGTAFPSLDHAMTDPNGLIAAGGDLSPARILAAYRRGIFPWYSAGQPILWWSPDPRMVLDLAEFRVSRSLRKRIRREDFELTCDSAFRDVVEACASAPRQGQFGTWITGEMIDAYAELHRRGYAHSIEAWSGDDLAGGLYGLAIGRVFFGESMFARESDASKVALVGLVSRLRALGVPMIDCQQETAHLASFGARAMSRRRFAARLAELIHSLEPPPGWTAGRLGEPL